MRILLALFAAVPALASFDQYSGTGFLYYDQKDRTQIISDICRELQTNYAPWDYKKQVISIDGVAACKQARAAELTIADVSGALEQAKSNLDFLDRARRLGATFQDTHLTVSPISARTMVYLPFEILKIEGKYVVSRINERTLKFLATLGDSPAIGEIAVGDELLEIDGMLTAKAVKELEPYVGGSSPGSRERQALDALTARDFRFPAQGKLRFKINSAKARELRVFDLAWLYTRATRQDEKLYLERNGFRTTGDLTYSWDSESKTWTKWKSSWTGYKMAEDLGSAQLDDVLTYNGENGRPAIRRGFYFNKGKAFTVLQLFTFNTDQVTESNTKETDTFLNVVRLMVRAAKRRELPLIIDIRMNSGGNGNYPPAVMGMLLQKDKKLPGPSAAFRVTHFARQIVDSYQSYEKFLGGQVKGIQYGELAQLVQDAVDAKALHTDAFSTIDIVTDEKVGGFDLPIVALISPECVSACDKMASLLKSSGRAKLIGEPTSGTGAGYRSMAPLTAGWIDTLKVVKMDVPNYLFGLGLGAPGSYRYPGALDACTENRPVLPDVAYSTTSDDIADADSGWLAKAIEVLEAK